MHLNHVNLPTPDPAGTCAFFVAHFGFTCLAMRGRNAMAILQDEGGSVLVLSRRQSSGAQSYPDGFHVGFHLADADAVLAVHRRLAGAGVAVGDVPVSRHGTTAFYVEAPGELLVEVACRA